MNFTISSSTIRPPGGPADPASSVRALSDRELVALAERHAAAGHPARLDPARAEAERRAQDQSPESLAAQIAGYISLLTEDPEHVLAEEARTWIADLHRALPHALPHGEPDGEPAAEPASAVSAAPVPCQRDSAVRS